MVKYCCLESEKTMRFNFIQKTLLSIIAILLVLVILLFGVKENPLIAHYNILGYDFFSTLTYTLIEKPVLSVGEYFSSIAHFEDTTRQLELMQSEIEKVAILKEQYAELKRENETLKELLALNKTSTDYQMISTNVIARDINGWHNFITIDVGEEDGIKKDQAVITDAGLIGKVYQVNKSTSLVKLITSEDGLNKISLKISQKEPVEAILEKYSSQDECFLVRVLDDNTEIELGSMVVTSAMGGVYPSGLLVGEVEKVEAANFLLGKIVYVKPSADFKNISIVNVIEREMDVIE